MPTDDGGELAGHAVDAERVLRTLCPPTCEVAVHRLGEAVPALMAEELVHVSDAVDKRVTEFRAGRACARRVMAAVGVSPQAVLNGPDRAPIWPDGFQGSISHTKAWAAAVGFAAGPASPLSVGLDVETIKTMSAGVREKIATDADREFILKFPEARRDALYTMLFAAKEAYYKCQYPKTREFVGFHAMSVDPARCQVDEAAEVQSVVLVQQRVIGQFPEGQAWTVRCAPYGNCVWAVAILSQTTD